VKLVTLREEQKLRMSDNRVLRIFGVKREEWWESGEDCIMRTLITCTLH
jgi:hypothetical protein